MLELRRRYGSSVPSGGGGRLPAGYQEVEWLMNKDGAYIETGVVPPDGCCFEVEAALKTAPLLQAPEYDYVVFGCDINYDKKGFSLSFNNTFASPALGIVFHMSNNLLTKGGTGVFPTTDVFYKYKYENGTCIINNEIVLSDNPFIQFGHAIDIFTLRRGTDHVGRQDGLKLKPLKLYTDTDDIAEFIPCRRLKDNEKGMYDIVNDVFYTNDGTGEFSCGMDVHYNIPPEYQQVEYLESNASVRQCIMIPITILETSSIELHIKYNSYNNTYQANCWANGAQITINGNGVWNTSNEPAKIGQKYISTIEIDDLGHWKFFIDGELKSNNISNSNTYFMYLFAASEPNLLGQYHYVCNASIYYAKIILKNGTIIKLIPCYRKVDDEAGMYDLVSGKFYTNAGTGKFEIGPPVI